LAYFNYIWKLFFSIEYLIIVFKSSENTKYLYYCYYYYYCYSKCCLKRFNFSKLLFNFVFFYLRIQIPFYIFQKFCQFNYECTFKKNKNNKNPLHSLFLNILIKIIKKWIRKENLFWKLPPSVYYKYTHTLYMGMSWVLC